MAKRIVLCFDGTWNTPADEALPPEDQVETNVVRFYESVAPSGADGRPQVKWYNPGVGTDWWDRVIGGGLGAGLDLHIVEGYRTLAEHYEPGDEIFVVGFSRGAYTARSLAGMIRNCGLVKRGFGWRLRIGTAYGIYRTRDDGVDSFTAKAFRSTFAHEVKIKFLGVWDTVGALGIPGGMADRLNTTIYQFHDTNLSGIVENAYHAVAIDEHRADYDVCLWTPLQKPAQTLEQRWFAGAHSDVGGGYPGRKLSDLSLRWMQDRAAAVGLGISSPVTLGADNYKAAHTDSYAEFLGGKYAKLRPPHYRRILCTDFGNECLDPSVDLRRREATLSYRPTNERLPAMA
jgi:uncharacterized protein (DUF2235 family)